ncbi:MAG: GIY-YIG nuclease family protein [Chitinophagales bacterium]
MPYFTYIIYSTAFDKFYVGSTSDSLEERIRRHNSNHSGFTGRTGDWKLVYSEEFPEKHMAIKREREIKAWKSRKRIELLVGSGK